MKILSIGDVHGTDFWKGFVLNPSEFDVIVFVGDYVDSFDKTNEQIKNNLLDIIEFKKSYPEKVFLLLGNHDIQYALNPPATLQMKYGCSGYRGEMHYDLYDIFNNNKDSFQVAYQYENYIWTHAGIHRGWYQSFLAQYNKYFQMFDENVAGKLNIAYKYEVKSLFDVGYLRWGMQKVGGIFWADKQETWLKPLKEYHQICGHTHIEDIKQIEYKKFNCSVTYIDVVTKPYILEL